MNNESKLENIFCELIDDIIEDIRKDFIKSKNDIDSRMYALELLSNLNSVLVKDSIYSTIQIENCYRNGDIYTLHEKLQELL